MTSARKDGSRWRPLVPSPGSMGHWTVADTSDGRALMRMRELPPAFARDRYWLDSVAASLGSLLDLAEVDGTVAIVRRVDDGADFEMVWQPRR